ncbi:hypothetical protein MKW92_016638 [Papaver armeniacum]|nr:hypothetical protein MKW92_016638 [Papaver armeniacum]
MPRKQPQPDKYTQALRKALMFFNAQRCKGDSGMKDGFIGQNLVGGFCDGGDAIKFNFPQSFAMTMLSWITGELNHVKEIIKWGAIISLRLLIVGTGDTSGWSGKIDTPNDHYCWMRPEDMDYPRDVHDSASIVFKDNKKYSKKLVHCAETLYQFARDKRGRYDLDITYASIFYNSTEFFGMSSFGVQRDYFMFFQNIFGAFSGGPSYGGIPSWENKLTGSQVIWYPYEDMLSTFNKQTDLIMCSYLPVFRSFKRTKEGLIQINGGAPQPLQFVVQAEFLATLYADYLDAAGIPGWYCGLNFYTTQVMHDFAKTRYIDYILGKNPRKMLCCCLRTALSKHVHHRAASIPKNKIKYTCEGGWKLRDTKKPDPNTIIGAMVGGLDKRGWVSRCAFGSLLPLSLYRVKAKLATSIDMSTMFSKIPPMFPLMAPGPAPWKP